MCVYCFYSGNGIDMSIYRTAMFRVIFYVVAEHRSVKTRERGRKKKYNQKLCVDFFFYDRRSEATTAAVIVKQKAKLSVAFVYDNNLFLYRFFFQFTSDLNFLDILCIIIAHTAK